MTASDDLLTMLRSAYDSLVSGDVSPLLHLVSSDAQCVVNDEVELRQERLPLPAAIQRLGMLTTSGHRVVAGDDAKVSRSGDRLWVTDLATVVLPDGALRPVQITLLATITADGALLVDQVNLAAPVRDRADSPLSLVS